MITIDMNAHKAVLFEKLTSSPVDRKSIAHIIAHCISTSSDYERRCVLHVSVRIIIFEYSLRPPFLIAKCNPVSAKYLCVIPCLAN